MGIGRYLPSSQFTLIVVSIALSAGLVYAADAVTSPKKTSGLLSPSAVSADTDWQSELERIQANSGVAALPEPLSQEAVSAFLDEAQSDNLTTTLARSLFINLSNAKSQGLGDDLPTQDKIIADVLQKAQVDALVATYSGADLKTVPQTDAAARTYGNTLISTLKKYPEADIEDTYFALGYAVDYRDAKYTKQLRGIGAAYASISEELTDIPVPATLAPLHLTVVNNFAATAAMYEEMALILADPVRGLGGFQQYQILQNEASHIFTNIAEELQSSGILFTKDEPGSAWSVFLPSP